MIHFAGRISGGMAEERLAFPAFKQGVCIRKDTLVQPSVKPFYYKYGGKEAISIALKEGGIGGDWEVIMLCNDQLELPKYHNIFIYKYIYILSNVIMALLTDCQKVWQKDQANGNK